jgi:hypothetical protein
MRTSPWSSEQPGGWVILIEDAGKPLLHLPLKADKSVVDAPKAGGVHSGLKNEVSAIILDSENLFFI